MRMRPEDLEERHDGEWHRQVNGAEEPPAGLHSGELLGLRQTFGKRVLVENQQRQLRHHAYGGLKIRPKRLQRSIEGLAGRKQSKIITEVALEDKKTNHHKIVHRQHVHAHH